MPHILIVDDYSVTQRTLGHILKRGGFSVATASNAEEALTYLQFNAVDMAIIDIMMPGMDGIEMLTILRQDENLKHLPVIMLTASGQDEDRIRARQAGASDFLTKPTSTDDLLNAVERLLNPI